MKILNNFCFNIQKPYYHTAFAGKLPVAQTTLAVKNIGLMPNGKIGKIELLRKDGKKVYLDVVKSLTNEYKDKHCNVKNELYTIEDEFGEIIGEMDITVNKAVNYDRINFPQDPSHVHVVFVCNHSDPKTEYYNDVSGEYEHVGTRLLQIALKRSEEAFGHRNINLTSVPIAKNFYKKLGFTEIPNNFGQYRGYMCLVPDGANTLAEKYGGL